jgi:two-component system sensor histidine kinase BaeS
MRLRLFLAFVTVALVAVVSVVLIARQGAASAVRTFMFRGSMIGIDDFASQLEDYYAANGSWQGIESSSLWPGGGQGQGYGRGMQGMMQGGVMGQRLRLADEDGSLMADTASPGLSGTAPGVQLTRREMDSAVELRADDRVVGYLLGEGGMGYNQSDETFLVNRISNAALIAGLIAGVLALVLASILAYRLLRPVQELTLAAESMAAGDLSQRVPVRGDDELATLGVAFNQMADSLQHAEESRRAMTADIAHELRNPLAVQRANLEALQDGIYPLTPDSLTPILDQNQMLTRLVDDLRTLALADSGRLDLVRTPTDLPALMQRAVERYSPQAAAREIQIVSHISENLPALSLDAQRIEQILNNLLDNALRHTPDGGKVEVSSSTSAQKISLSVHDSGAGIPQDALPYIFERFYRADRSRSRAEGGTGLGLTIARQLAEAHGGTLSAANHPQGGAVFTLVLPA